ncbi:MAG: hypothetical protein L6Q92_10825 [Phycisphaerae bacterium]|nr:hypothetical protein [Phycisphaerae bacterium]
MKQPVPTCRAVTSRRLQAGAALCLLISGCGAAARVSLEQPFLAGPEQRLHLTSESVRFASGGGTDRVLVEFPLPGAWSGRHYLLYVRVPSKTGSYEIAQPFGGERVGGFFIQLFGDHRGLTGFASGRVDVRGVLAAPSKRRCELDVKCTDGSLIRGTLVAQRDELGLREFEERTNRGDVQALLRAASPTADGAP